MSLFLGPIHIWMFNKILILESRAFALAEALEKSGNGGVGAVVEEYGQRLEGRNLADILGDNSIHQFLYGLIGRAQIMEARLMELAGDGGAQLVKVAEEHGRQTARGAVAKAGSNPQTLEDIYRQVNDHHMEGMPCDPGAETTQESKTVMGYCHSSCNHIQNWSYTGADVKAMCGLTNAWLAGFVSELNPAAVYEVKETLAEGAGSCRATITLG
ncbi:MAG: hypothetical protein HY751_04955 [Nitrospinae bacterium]|nr:hypothetical protein [Nitrospinota bacterium]